MFSVLADLSVSSQQFISTKHRYKQTKSINSGISYCYIPRIKFTPAPTTSDWVCFIDGPEVEQVSNGQDRQTCRMHTSELDGTQIPVSN